MVSMQHVQGCNSGTVQLAWQHRLAFILGLCLLVGVSTTSYAETPDIQASGLPAELRHGVIRFEVERGNALGALALLDKQDRDSLPVAYASALNGFGMDKDEIYTLLERARKDASALRPEDLFQLGKIYYSRGDCIPALKAFKHLANKLSLEAKQEWAFYRANCSIKLGSPKRAAQVLSDLLNGLWVSHAYYNLAMAYNEASTNKTRALVALRVAASLNPGKTRLEKELHDRIYYAAGSFYLESEKARQASDFLKKIHLDSLIAPQALYLHGVALLEQKDFRAATQSWFSVRKYPTIQQGVPESLLAIPYAYEGSGYVSQALEAYLEASDSFEKELNKIRKLSELIAKHGVQDVLIEEKKLKDLEWFLSKDVATNTQRAAYYTHLIEDESIYQAVAQLTELRQLHDRLKLWQSKLTVFDTSLKRKTREFKSKASNFNKLKLSRQVSSLPKKLGRLSALDGNDQQVLQSAIKDLQHRLAEVEEKVNKGSARLQAHRAEIKRFQSALKSQVSKLKQLLERYDSYITGLAIERLALLEKSMLANYERAEQGLVHMLETIAEANQPVRNRLDGRYQ